MERWPLDASNTSAPEREWKGTLVAEWLDRGPEGGGEPRSWAEAGVALPLFAFVGIVFYLTAAQQALAVAFTGAMAAVFVASILISRLRAKPPVRTALVLDPDTLSLTRATGTLAETIELPRGEACALIRPANGRRLLLTDREGRVRMQLVGRGLRRLGRLGIRGPRSVLGVILKRDG